MKNKLYPLIVAIVCVLLIVPAALIPVSAESETAYSLNRLTDDAGLLSDDEYTALLNRLDEISVRQGCDVVIVTVASLDEGYTPTSFADDVFDYFGFGLGSGKDGILLLLSMEERDWAISTHGYGITAFTDAGQEYIVDKMKDALSNNEYNTAFNIFADQCDAFLTQAKTGEPYDTSNLPTDKSTYVWAFVISLAFGVLIAFIVTQSMASKLTSVHSANEAENYTLENSLNVRSSRDTFKSRSVSKVRRQTESSSDGGSSTHTSSSGETHGGSSGKF